MNSSSTEGTPPSSQRQPEIFEWPEGAVWLPVKMPTLNDLMTYHPMRYHKIRNLIREFVSRSSITDRDSLIPETFKQRRQLMSAFVADYYQTIQRSTSRKKSTRRNSSEAKMKSRQS